MGIINIGLFCSVFVQQITLFILYPRRRENVYLHFCKTEALAVIFYLFIYKASVLSFCVFVHLSLFELFIWIINVTF